MSEEQPDWNTPLAFMITPEAIMSTMFATAEEVHTGWDSCVNSTLAFSDTTAVDSQTGNHCRLVEQEYTYDDQPDVTWHDWTVELRIGEVYVIAHWRVQVNESPAMWSWSASESENAFMTACTLIGQRVRRGLIVEGEAATGLVPPRSRHH
ncbi:MAG: hypothetical protein HOI95_11790 [Chromatiales bacterium]|jgi:hypothetical protein|nr:hypothetical protein [Chromatiales bacterium]